MTTSPTAGKRVEVTREDFGPNAWDDLIEAAHPVFAEVHDIQHHHMADSTWRPSATLGDVPALAGELRAVIAQLEAPLKDLRRALARAESAARLRAHHRAKNGPDLTGHCIVVERLDAQTALQIGRPGDAGQYAVIECHDGRRGKVCAIGSDLRDNVPIDHAARNIASTYGARYAGVRP